MRDVCIYINIQFKKSDIYIQDLYATDIYIRRNKNIYYTSGVQLSQPCNWKLQVILQKKKIQEHIFITKCTQEFSFLHYTRRRKECNFRLNNYLYRCFLFFWCFFSLNSSISTFAYLYFFNHFLTNMLSILFNNNITSLFVQAVVLKNSVFLIWYLKLTKNS